MMLCSSAVPTHRARRVHRWFGLIAEHAPRYLGELTAPFLFGATLDQELNGWSMAFVCGPHQCGGASQRFLCVYVCAMIE